MTAAPPADGLRWWRRLHVRAAAGVLLVLAALGLASAWIANQQTRDGALEALQRQSLGLAEAIAQGLPATVHGADGRLDPQALHALAHHVMMLNPTAEVYLLDGDGRVRGHALDNALLEAGDPLGRQVDVDHLRQLLPSGGPAPMLPVWNIDPRLPGQPAIFSVAALPTVPQAEPGYVYVVLRPPEVAPFASSQALQAGTLALAAATVAAALALAAVLRHLTRPLDGLTRRVQGFRPMDEAPPGEAPRDEIALLDQAVRRLQARVEQQIADLHEAARQHRELVGNISHDLRTPLSSIQGYVETVLLAGDRLDAEARAAHLRTALRHAGQLGQRIASLFELSTLDAGRVVPHFEVFCLAELLQDVVHGYEVQARQRGISLQLDGGSHLRTRVRADIALIERVLQNLIDNALRHTPAGGSVTLSLAGTGPTVEVGITDTGSGIAADHLPHIFERYWHGHDDTPAGAPERVGGLGLAIVRRILELHGSMVQVHSALRSGSSFRFVLPQVP